MPISFTFSVAAPPGFVAGTGANDTAARDAGALALRDKKLDPLTGDLQLDDTGDQVFTTGVDGIAADLKSNWLFFKGEYFLNLLKGIDYWGVIFAKGSTLQDCEEEYRREALATPGVAAIDLVLTKTGRQLGVAAVVTTDTGLIFKAVLGVNAGS